MFAVSAVRVFLSSSLSVELERLVYLKAFFYDASSNESYTIRAHDVRHSSSPRRSGARTRVGSPIIEPSGANA